MDYTFPATPPGSLSLSVGHSVCCSTVLRPQACPSLAHTPGPRKPSCFSSLKSYKKSWQTDFHFGLLKNWHQLVIPRWPLFPCGVMGLQIASIHQIGYPLAKLKQAIPSLIYWLCVSVWAHLPRCTWHRVVVVLRDNLQNQAFSFCHMVLKPELRLILLVLEQAPKAQKHPFWDSSL